MGMILYVQLYVLNKIDLRSPYTLLIYISYEI